MLRTLLDTCQRDTLLCVAVNLSKVDESIATHTIREWAAKAQNLDKKPAVFLLHREPNRSQKR